MEITTLPADVSALQSALSNSHVILDAVFGFSFKGPVRPPFDDVLRLIQASNKPIVSVDIPSGWDVERGPMVDGPVIMPDVLVSLTAPKEGAREFRGRHFLGGRVLENKYELNLPEYPGVDQVVELLPQDESDIAKKL
ncbi:hypothetical protein ID866_8203 [Astraeus odoratus]|nr:hypothetical protein ID866_8203 [Astraeus odoratus]